MQDREIAGANSKASGQLSQVYEDLGRSVQIEVVRTEVTEWFTGATLLLLALAGAASLAWFGRLP